MNEWLSGLSTIEQMFVSSTLVGVALFALRILLSIIGGGSGDADDIATSGDAGLAAFRILSLQGLSAFTLMFGLVGLALSYQEGASPAVSVGGGAVAGLITVWIIGRLLVSMGQLESDGTIRLSRAIGEVGTVYLTIPPGGVGKVRVVVQERLRVCDAVSHIDAALPTGTRIRVVDVQEGSLLVVEPYQSTESEAM